MLLIKRIKQTFKDTLRAGISYGILNGSPIALMCYGNRLCGFFDRRMCMTCFFIGSLFIFIEKRNRLRMNMMFMAPRFLEFIYERFKVRGIFSAFLLFKIFYHRLMYKFAMAFLFGMLALCCGIDGNEKKIRGYIQTCI